MTAAAILTLLKDIAIGGSIVYILWFIHHADTNAVTVSNLKAVQAQLAANTAAQNKWEQEMQDAEAQRRIDIAAVNAHIDAQHAPIIVRVPPGTGAVPVPPSCPAGSAAGSGGGDGTPGESFDARAQINDYERWVESNFATCRSFLKAWPHD